MTDWIKSARVAFFRGDSEESDSLVYVLGEGDTMKAFPGAFSTASGI